MPVSSCLVTDWPFLFSETNLAISGRRIWERSWEFLLRQRTPRRNISSGPMQIFQTSKYTSPFFYLTHWDIAFRHNYRVFSLQDPKENDKHTTSLKLPPFPWAFRRVQSVCHDEFRISPLNAAGPNLREPCTCRLCADCHAGKRRVKNKAGI